MGYKVGPSFLLESGRLNLHAIIKGTELV
jgi:hypothetical protein